METITFVKETVGAGYNFFEKYVASFIDCDDELVSESLMMKKEHSKRVASLSRLIAEKLLLDQEEQDLAEFIGLVHDLGRFSQFTQYRTFNDEESVNHAEQSVDILTDQEFLFSVPESNRQILIDAIKYHNQAVLPDTLDKQTVLFCQILRDADKLDLWKTCVDKLKRDGSFQVSSISGELPKNGRINDAVLKSIKKNQLVSKKDLKSVDDFKLFLISMVFDLNFKMSFQLLNEQQLIKKLYESLPKKDDVYEAYREVRLYVENMFVI